MSTLKSAPANRAQTGPFDVAEVETINGYADFGGIKLPVVENAEIRIEYENETQRLLAVSVDYADSTIQLQAFAAPKSEGLWHEVRKQIAESIAASGSEVTERLGSFGPELFAKLELTDESGKSVGIRYARFIGVDGPRWFLRGMIGGAAINDSAASSLIENIFRSAVIDRGVEPIPPRDLLPLHLPAGVVPPPRNLELS